MRKKTKQMHNIGTYKKSNIRKKTKSWYTQY